MELNKCLIIFIISFISCTYLNAQNTCISNGSGEWGDPGSWNCTGGAAFPDLTVSTVNILDGDNITLTNTIEGGFNYDFLTPQDTLEVTINLDGDLIFDGLGAGLLLTDDSEIIFGETGDLESDGAFVDVIVIGDNVVWNGQSDGDVAGPGIMDENTVGGALPIVLMSFDAKVVGTNVKIFWQTAIEENNDFFTVQRSSDGINYEHVSTIDGAGNSTDPLSYSYVDTNPLIGKSYYRLTQTDYDGKSEAFAAKVVKYSTLSDIIISPNPVQTGAELKIYSNISEEEKFYITIYNASGAKLIEKTIENGGVTSVPISDTFKSGLYLINARANEKQLIKRLIVK